MAESTLKHPIASTEDVGRFDKVGKKREPDNGGGKTVLRQQAPGTVVLIRDAGCSGAACRSSTAIPLAEKDEE